MNNKLAKTLYTSFSFWFSCRGRFVFAKKNIN